MSQSPHPKDFMTDEEAYVRFGDVSQGAATSVQSLLPSYGISDDDAERMNREYNQEQTLLIPKESFLRIIHDVVKSTEPAEVETKVAKIMKEKSILSREKFRIAVFKMLVSGPDCLEDEQQQSDFGAALSHDHTIHEFEALVACLPEVVAQIHDHRRKERDRLKKKKSTKGSAEKGVLKVVSKPTFRSSEKSGVRNSSRGKPPVPEPHTPPSEGQSS